LANRIYITNIQKKKRVPLGAYSLIRKCCEAVLIAEGFPYFAEISVRLVDNEEIKRLNGEYRRKNEETDVLSFPMFEGGQPDEAPADKRPVVLGDIVISLEKAYTQAEAYSHSIRREIGFLTAHSMLHLLGRHHEEGKSEKAIRETEEAVLSKLGLSREKKNNGRID